MGGEEVTALVDACDRYGNPTVFKGETVTVSASGPAHMPQERAFEVADMRGGRVICNPFAQELEATSSTLP